MDIANSLLHLVNNLWDLASRPLGYVCNLRDNSNSLRNATGQLNAKSKDMLATVEREEGGGHVQRTEEVAYWLDTVQKFVGRVDQTLREVEERDQIKCLSRCLPPNCWSSYTRGKRVDQMLNEVRELQPKEGEFDCVTLPLPSPPVLNMPMDETVRLDISNLDVWKWVVDEKQVGVIGLYGIGGVGKTALMRRIEEKLSRANNGFDIVIWALVSKPVNKDRIQEDIRRRIDIQNAHWEQLSKDERVHLLCQALTRKKFVLMLDDLWEGLDLSEIGVPRPSPQNGSKVVFTTRQEQVCSDMGADEIFQVPCLTPEKALELFENKVGKLTMRSNPQIPKLAEEVARECKGLPLALIVVGRAMAGRKDPSEWKHALATLRKKPHKLLGMEDLYNKLAFSYDSLYNPTFQLCFLYCCLFPEDYLICTDDLIDLWIGGDLLGDTDDIHSLRNEGKFVLGSLKMACLLESGTSEWGRQCVKMHDVIRDMATWISRDHGRNENKLLVIEKDEDMSMEMISKLGEVEKISLWGEFIQNIPGTLAACSQLQILFVRKTKVMHVPGGFFNSACLTVLDMSYNKDIQLFPEEICNLIRLQYLNLSFTGIRELPREIKNLTCLRWLLLDREGEQLLIPIGAIASLPLNVFSQWVWDDDLFWPNLICYGRRSFPSQSNEEEIEELERMQHLTDLSIFVSKASLALKIFQSPNLRRIIRKAGIEGCQDLTGIIISCSPTISSVFSHLGVLFLVNCPVLEKIEITQRIGRAPNCCCFPSLVHVYVQNCGLLDLSWLVHAPELSTLRISYCDSLEKIIGEGYVGEESAASGLFSHLQSLIISDVPSLTSIYEQTLSFPELKWLYISRCLRLRKLPLDSNSARGSLNEIFVDRDWWDNLEWDDDAARSIFAAKVKFTGQSSLL